MESNQERERQRPGAPGEDTPMTASPGLRPESARSETRNEMRAVATLAWPIAAAMLGETVIGIVDTFLVSGLGRAAIGGVGLATIFMFLSYSFVYGLMRGVKIRTSHAIGEGRPDAGFSYLLAGLLCGVATGALVFVFGRDASWLFSLTHADPEIVPYAREFLAAITWGAPATCALAALIQHRQATGDARSPMIAGLLGNVFHGVVGYALIYGKFGLPMLGAKGAGYATSLTEVLEMLALLALVLRDARGQIVRAFHGVRVAFREVLSTGLPTALQFSFEVFAFTAFTAILGSIASTEIAAHQVTLSVIRASFLPGIAISEAACVLVGQALGAKDEARVMRVARAGLKLGVSFMAACGVVFAVFGGRIAHAFTNDMAVVHVATRLLYVAAAFQVCDAVTIVLRGVLRGAKDTTYVAIVGVVVSFLTVPTFALVLGKFYGMGALGGWLGFIAETTLNALLLSIRVRQAPWRARLAREKIESASGVSTKNEITAPKGAATSRSGSGHDDGGRSANEAA